MAALIASASTQASLASMRELSKRSEKILSNQCAKLCLEYYRGEITAESLQDYITAIYHDARCGRVREYCTNVEAIANIRIHVDVTLQINRCIETVTKLEKRKNKK